jgi:hypothetical protein
VRILLVLALSILVMTPADSPASATVVTPLNNVSGVYLFSLGDTSFVQCQATLGLNDSANSVSLGACISGSPPIWKFISHDLHPSLVQGDSVVIERFEVPRRAGVVAISCSPEVIDPLTIHSRASYTAASLFHRTIFQYDSAGRVVGDLAKDWSWRGSDLIIEIDTSLHFSDGSRIDAAAVKYSLERYFWYRRNVPAYSWHYSIAGVKNYLNGFAQGIVGLIPRSADTLQINMIRPLFELPAYLTSTRLAVVRWEVAGDQAPVVATSGYYGPPIDFVANGRSPHGGSLILNNVNSPDGMLKFGTDGTGHVTYISNVAVPNMLVLKAASGLNPSILSFVHFALDRWVMGEVSTGADPLRPAGIYPVCVPCETWSNGTVKSALRSRMWQGADTIAMADARAARRMLRGSPRIRVSYADGQERAADYLVDWLKAWDLRGELTSDSVSWDVRIEHWQYDGFSQDAWAETALWNLQLGARDTLVQRLITARGVRDPIMRALAYKSLLSRIEESASYVVLYQDLSGFSFNEKEPLVDLTLDILGRPRGPIFIQSSGP